MKAPLLDATPQLQAALDDLKDRQPRYALYRDYYDGNHRLLFATDKFRNAFGNLFREFADNLCPAVADSLTDVLQISGWQSAAAVDADDPAAAAGQQAQDEADVLGQAASDIWDRERMNTWAGAVHGNAVVEGDGFLLVWPDADDEKRARFWHQEPGTMAVAYDTERPDTLAWAAKVWKIGKRWRANLYFDDGMIRLITKGSSTDGGVPKAAAFAPVTHEDLGTEDDGLSDPSWEPYEWPRIPVFHFPNGLPGRYGRSHLVPVVPLQDGLNKSIADMLVAAEFHAYPQRWATGLETKYDETGQEVAPFQAGADRLWTTASEFAQFGVFDPTSLEPFLKIQDGFRLEIARVSATPMHSLDLTAGSGRGAAPSGEALKVAAQRRTSQAKDRSRDWGETWEAAMGLALLIEGHGVLDPEDPAVDLEAMWVDPAPSDDLAWAQSAQIKVSSLGWSYQQVQRDAGLDPEVIERMAAEREEAGLDQQEATALLGGGRAAAPGLAGRMAMDGAVDSGDMTG